jgi:hypothetical protein
LHESDVEAINGPGESRKGTWWSHRQGGYATAYVSKRTARKRVTVLPAPRAPNAVDRNVTFGPEFQGWTTGQRASFQQLLK